MRSNDPGPWVTHGLKQLRQRAIKTNEHEALIEATMMVQIGLRYIREIKNEKEALWWMADAFEQADVWGAIPEIIVTARTPEHWAARLTDTGVPVDAAMIRDRALAQQKFYDVAGRMLLSPRQLDAIFTLQPPRLSSSHEASAFKKVMARLRRSKGPAKRKR